MLHSFIKQCLIAFLNRWYLAIAFISIFILGIKYFRSKKVKLTISHCDFGYWNIIIGLIIYFYFYKFEVGGCVFDINILYHFEISSLKLCKWINIREPLFQYNQIGVSLVLWTANVTLQWNFQLSTLPLCIFMITIFFMFSMVITNNSFHTVITDWWFFWTLSRFVVVFLTANETHCFHYIQKD